MHVVALSVSVTTMLLFCPMKIGHITRMALYPWALKAGRTVPVFPPQKPFASVACRAVCPSLNHLLLTTHRPWRPAPRRAASRRRWRRRCARSATSEESSAPKTGKRTMMTSIWETSSSALSRGRTGGRFSSSARLPGERVSIHLSINLSPFPRRFWDPFRLVPVMSQGSLPSWCP